jgi:hypothetical protein
MCWTWFRLPFRAGPTAIRSSAWLSARPPTWESSAAGPRGLPQRAASGPRPSPHTRSATGQRANPMPWHWSTSVEQSSAIASSMSSAVDGHRDLPRCPSASDRSSPPCCPTGRRASRCGWAWAGCAPSRHRSILLSRASCSPTSSVTAGRLSLSRHRTSLPSWPPSSIHSRTFAVSSLSEASRSTPPWSVGVTEPGSRSSMPRVF